MNSNNSTWPNNKESKMATRRVLFLTTFFVITVGQEARKSPIVLDDGNFEHLTQAATGATTGDWLILFSQDVKNCPKCDVALNVFHVLTERLSRRLNIAVVEGDKNKGLLRRFKINHFPTIYFFRHGFQFAYMGELDESRLEQFVLGGYRDVRKEAVSKELSDFDILVDDTIKEIMISIKERKLPSNTTMAFAVGTFLFCLSILFCCCSGTRPKPVSATKKKQ